VAGVGEPEAFEMPWPEDDPRYRLRLWVQRGGDGHSPAIVGVELWGVEPIRRPWFESVVPLPDTPQRITADDIRLPLGWMLDTWVDRKRRLARATLETWPDAPGQDKAVARYEAGLTGPRTGRPPQPESFLRRVAAVYQRAVEDGDRAPALAVARAIRHPDRPETETLPETARSWIKQARRRGYLAPTGRKTR
jgi:hypothetical protein